MSGTSADGIDVAIVRLTGSGLKFRFNLVTHQHFAYSKPVRAAILQTMNAKQISVAELSRLNFLLGELYADAIQRTQKASGATKLDLVGCHGQTIYHQGDAKGYLGKKVACTWQTGEGAVVAARLRVPVVSDFRPADMAAGGKGAPLVPLLDYALFRHRSIGKIIQNIGGIANLTAIPAAATPTEVLAFDTGPGNMLIDQLMQKLMKKPYDRNGALAARGKILQPVLEECLRHRFFALPPPRTAGREEFGHSYAEQFLRRCGRAPKPDVVATATALTAQSIARAIGRFVAPRGEFREFVVSGGGTRNGALMHMLKSEICGMGMKLKTTDDFGLPSQAKEAAAFSLLAYQTWNRQPGNIPSATGAERPAVLGKISYA